MKIKTFNTWQILITAALTTAATLLTGMLMFGSPQWRQVLPALVGALIGVLWLMFSTGTVSALFPALVKTESRHLGDQRQILAYLCNVLGLKQQEEEYRSADKKVEYWSESDRLATSALSSDSESDQRQIMNLLSSLPEYAAVTNSSMAIIYLNVARLAGALGEHQKKKKFIEKARRLAPKMIKKRLEIDRAARLLLEPESP